MEKKKSNRRKIVVVPKDRTELEQFVAKIREAEEKINVLLAEAAGDFAAAAARVNDIRQSILDKTKPLEEEINEWAKGVYVFAEGHRLELTEDEKRKTVEFLTGDKIRWYFPSPSVVIEDEEAAIAELERRGLAEFIRVKKEVNKEAILQHPEKIERLKNLSISQMEIFAIVPAKMDFELQKGDRKFKKVKLS